ncbi:MAG TPA: hypothetical protein ENN31_01165 [Candidatus Vogelbacteria bacterium]|nr:hypothetical protein [Candidatus Vogelbacteria bacterium]
MDKDDKKKSKIALQEEEILKFWLVNKIFKKSLTKSNPQGDFVMYDGPPFATGDPHYGHILPTSLKDLIPRFKTMKGYRVARRWGWDCHGLPIENITEKEIGLESKRDIIEYGLDKFNRQASVSVLRCAGVWQELIPRMGRWVDMEDDYRTMDTEYTETIWWIFKRLFDQGLIYEGFKSLHLCPRCETTLSNFEVNQGYADIEDISVIVKIPLVGEKDSYLLIWTTTPWTLPANVAVAINPEFIYCRVEHQGQFYIVAKNLIEKVFGKKVKIIEEMSGNNLVGKEYQPIFSYYQRQDMDNGDKAWKIYPANFVSLEEGTGLVHIAPAFGEDDLELARKFSLPLIQHIGQNGRFLSQMGDLAGLVVKTKNDSKSIDEKICSLLEEKDLLFKRENIIHSYPHCWRCDTPLLNYGTNSWFVKVTDFKDKLLKNNSQINWVPAHIKEGRFGKWLENTRDWAISRSRFWGASIPVWVCDSCQGKKVFGSITELEEALPLANNQYWVMRHGQAESNVKNILSSALDNQHDLSELGRQQVKDKIAELKKLDIDLIIYSPLLRTKNTASLVANLLGLKDDKLIADERLREIEFGQFELKSVDDYINHFSGNLDRFERAPVGGENLKDVLQRVSDVLFEVEEKYKNKKILFVTHETPAWLLLSAGAGFSIRQMINIKNHHQDFIDTADYRPLKLSTLPRNEFGEIDLHRPFIDQAQLDCSCGGKLKRIEDVFDCWFESGAMPYGQRHYPFKTEEDFQPDKGIGLPADFIAEGLDQTRGWFYSLLVISTALFDRPAYKNVIVNGIVLAEDGQKMSKRLKNYPDISDIVNDYGADALRIYLLSSPVVRGEDFSFSTKGLMEVSRRIISRLDNILIFYETYADKDVQAEFKDDNILDHWMKARLDCLTLEIEKLLEAYEIDKATKLLDGLVDDFSTWYLRRSRSRFKDEDIKERKNASAALKKALHHSATILAPFAPFMAERIYQQIRSNDEPESIHLTSWPEIESFDKEILENMEIARKICSLALEKRSQLGLKVRQPLKTLFIGDEKISKQEELKQIISQEINVNEITFVADKEDSYLELDSNLTPELLLAGQLREFIRQVQNLRKKNGFSPNDKADLKIYCNSDFGKFLEKSIDDLKRQASLRDISIQSFTDSPHEVEKIIIDDKKVAINLKKV